MVQIRERDLAARDLYWLTKAVTERLRGRGTLVLVNDRADIAACAGAGVHLTTRSLTAEVVRDTMGPDFLIGVSTHNQQEAEIAERGGADFIVFGPVFETPDKAEYGEPVGLAALRLVATSLTIPVIALGGIKPTNFHQAFDAGAAGVAGISMFVEAVKSRDLGELVSRIKDWN
jgi:thiamine-phosphate pyrophosphorylase